MKLVRYGAPGREKPGMIDQEGRIRDLSKVVPDIAGAALSPASLNKLRKLKPEKLPLVKGKPRIGACVGKVGNFIAIGLNYSDHAAEAGMQIPKEPTSSTRRNPASAARTTTPWSRRIPPSSTGRSSLASSSASAPVICRRTVRSTLSPAIASPTTSPSASFRSSAPGNGPRARAARPFGPLGPARHQERAQGSAKSRNVA